MILDTEVEILLVSKRNSYYRSLGYEIEWGKKILVKIEHLCLGSKVEINVKCDICGIEKIINYQKYIKNIKGTGIYCCSNICSVFKTKKTNLEKYGFENPGQSDIVREKMKNTCLEKYGEENTCRVDSVREKMKQTRIKRYGTSSILGSENAKNKKNETCLKRYGVIHALQNKELFEKSQITGKKIKIHNLTNLKYQGTYEKDFLDFCFYKNINVEKIPTIKYFFKESERCYYPDFYLPVKNLIIEIKSKYYYEINLEKNIEKKKACLEQGYNFIFIIDKDYSELNTIL